MGLLCGYYAAADDHDVRQAVVHAGGGEDGIDHDQVLVDGVDPVVDLPWVEFVLTGRSSRFIKSDPQHGRVVGKVRDGDVVSVSITDSLRDALASADRQFLNDVASNWRLSDSCLPPPDATRLADFLAQMAALAERAIAQGYSLYCWKALK
ncbi:hypothetical protein [Streptomyces sp. NBC_00347]|uniref:hypothetical protein n=1 Tax=Streptomyces sp. NBC_00347 TaxID=2975721 RepID=UPI00225679D1|nr:hypothetical protein [Streptomyces sp. NBC_00347]MCX5126874.1 hypothetical protein [Streptomyces sp. NBC_00347]